MIKLKLFTSLLLFATIISLTNCKKKVKGCTNQNAVNYNAEAIVDDGSCVIAKKIGESFAGGIIFYVDASGVHGLVAATGDQSNSKAWLNTQAIATNATETAIGTGQSNTNLIVSAYGTGSYAAAVCNDLVLAGFSDWYLPSKTELKLMYTNLHIKGLGGFAMDRYWSSTEANLNDAICVEFYSGAVEQIGKVSAISVRAVRSF